MTEIAESSTAGERPGTRLRWRRWAGCGCAGAGALVVLGAVLFPWIVSRLGGADPRPPAEIHEGLSGAARAVVERALEGLEVERLVDLHVHVAGLGEEGSGCWVNPAMLSWRHPWRHLQFQVYLDAAGVEPGPGADAAYVERLVDLIRHGTGGGRHWLLAFDWSRRPDGSVDRATSTFFVPNEYVVELAERHPGVLAPAMSVHPYRADALEALERWAARGARLVKWLPNSMGIDPADPRCAPYYGRMRELGLVLLSHAGEEQAVHAEEAQRLGNPLRLRAALDAGVKVVVAHCASLGTDVDLDDPAGRRVSSFELFVRLMDEPRYRGLVWGELSGITQVNRLGAPLAVLLAREDLHERLVNGSDWPLPAVNALFHTGALVRAGYLSAEEGAACDEVFRFDPLLYDLLVKRLLRSPETGRGFPASVFEERPELGL